MYLNLNTQPRSLVRTSILHETRRQSGIHEMHIVKSGQANNPLPEKKSVRGDPRKRG